MESEANGERTERFAGEVPDFLPPGQSPLSPQTSRRPAVPGGHPPDDQPVSLPRQPIRVLPVVVSARIAAGEVVERPAAVVKELVENAFDAGARQVRVDVRGGGLDLIRVGDDGSGIRAAELWLACQRHATSKLSGSSLAQVRTLGFRGEALPSIAAVSEISIVSASDDRGVGWRLTQRDGQVIADEPAPRPRGTTVTVRHLFQNMPARLAVMGRAQTEVGQIGQMMRRLAIAAPRTRIMLTVDDRSVFETTGSGDLATTLVESYGASLQNQLFPLGPVEIAEARIWGVAAGAEVTRPGRGQINLIVNGRWVQPRGLLHLLEAAYRPVLPRGRHPVVALVIEVPPDQVDINVHPAKLEIRLMAERAIGEAAGEMVRAALGRRPRSLQAGLLSGAAALAQEAWLAEPAASYDDAGPIVTPGLPPLQLIGQIQQRLILLEGPAGLYLVDQHRAHERILFDRLRGTHSPTTMPEPLVLAEPLVLELRPAQAARFGQRLEELAALGFACERFGGRTFLVRTAPALPGVLTGGDDEGLRGLGEPGEIAASLLAQIDDEPGEGEQWRDRLLVQLSCRTAVRRGRPLAHAAMRALIDGLGRTSAPAVCPHGSPLLMHVSDDLLERQFDWR
ncbi:MAG: DNA mismatch repair endonuclease MutL [Chloroflexota bacterium]|nr:DNA mismatch repair endonuclease MutL [Chloroflexota bacterium]